MVSMPRYQGHNEGIVHRRQVQGGNDDDFMVACGFSLNRFGRAFDNFVLGGSVMGPGIKTGCSH